MNRPQKVHQIRERLRSAKPSIGSWIQLPDASVAEVMGAAGYDWIAVDLEHGSIGIDRLSDIFRALELGGTLPLARVAQGHPKDCKQALDAGAGGVIVPMIESADQLVQVRDACRWPPAGRRGVGFSRANLFGRRFDKYAAEAQAPLLVAMIENASALRDLSEIVRVEGLDAVMIGPYDLSASLGITAQFDHDEFQAALSEIRNVCRRHEVPCGMHVVNPNPDELSRRLNEGFQFLAYSIDAVFLAAAAVAPRQASQ